MPSLKKQKEPMASAWMIFEKQMSLGNSGMKSAAFADFLLLKEQL
jgi:hypothetical protein